MGSSPLLLDSGWKQAGAIGTTSFPVQAYLMPYTMEEDESVLSIISPLLLTSSLLSFRV